MSSLHEQSALDFGLAELDLDTLKEKLANTRQALQAAAVMGGEASPFERELLRALEEEVRQRRESTGGDVVDSPGATDVFGARS